MVVYELSQVKPGMLTAKDVYTPRGQLIVPSASRLSQQMIQHMKYYNIATVAILPNEVSPANPLREERETSYENRIRNNKEFLHFKQEYSQSISLFQSHLESFLSGEGSLDTGLLLQDTLRLFDNNLTTFSMLDMLHNMRSLDDSTYVHSINVAVIVRLLGIWCHLLPADLDVLTLSGLLHDIGKTRISGDILCKPDYLTDEEYETMKTHTTLGYEMIKDADLDPRIKDAVLLHHERYDGKGYPQGLAKDAIPEFAAMVAIADVYDALTSDRCYRTALCPFEVIAMFEKNGLSEYHPKYILPFLKNIAQTYLHHKVALNDGSSGEIMMITDRITRPLIRLDDGSFVSLEKRLDLYVEEIL